MADEKYILMVDGENDLPILMREKNNSRDDEITGDDLKMSSKCQTEQKNTFLDEDLDEYIENYVDEEDELNSFDADERKSFHDQSNEEREVDAANVILENEVDNGIKNEHAKDILVDTMDEDHPCTGMEFDCHEEAYNFYNQYAGKMGFSIRKYSTSNSHRTHEIIFRRYSCSREGFRDARSKRFEERLRNRSDVRTGCKAGMTIRKKGNKWVISQVKEEHNHQLATPSKRHKLRSLRKITEGQGKMLENMRLAGVKTNLMMSYMALEAGGVRNVGFIERDARNFLTIKRQKELKNGDAEAVLDYFERQQLENPSFFYSIQMDSKGRMTNFFWADARSRMDYHHFGDVVCFDPTYGTNRYVMPFVPIVGTNHHYQTVLFGGALLYNETEESFVWVITTWMRAMNGRQPKVILTDQESAIGGAIKQVLDGTRHRYCLWHISRNAMKNLPHVINAHKDFMSDFNNCLYGYETVEEFVLSWEAIYA